MTYCDKLVICQAEFNPMWKCRMWVGLSGLIAKPNMFAPGFIVFAD